MSTIEMETKIKALKEWEAIIAEAQAEAEAVKDEIKREMDARGVEELEAGTHIIRWMSVLTQRFDSTRFKKDLPDVYIAYVKQVSSKRFTIAG